MTHSFPTPQEAHFALALMDSYPYHDIAPAHTLRELVREYLRAICHHLPSEALSTAAQLVDEEAGDVFLAIYAWCNCHPTDDSIWEDLFYSYELLVEDGFITPPDSGIE